MKDFSQTFIDQSSAVIYLKDENGHYLMVNRKGEERLQAKPDDILGKTDYDYFSKEDADQFRANDLKVINAGKPMSFKETHTFAGKQITIIDHKFPVSLEGYPNAIGGIAIEF